jgi:hypothetical protein
MSRRRYKRIPGTDLAVIQRVPRRRRQEVVVSPPRPYRSPELPIVPFHGIPPVARPIVDAMCRGILMRIAQGKGFSGSLTITTWRPRRR